MRHCVLLMAFFVAAQTSILGSDQPRPINPEDVLTKFVQVVGEPTASIKSSITAPMDTLKDLFDSANAR